ncbi:MAG TPA: tetratricopeptide repeat protein [Oculatellaceae cyanobacterium]
MPFDFLKPKQKQQNQNQNQNQTTQGFGSNRYPTDMLLGELMVKAGVITQAQLDDALKLSANKHLQLGQMLIMAGNISPRDLQAAVDAQSMLRDRSVDQATAAKCLKIATKTGMSFADVYRDQIGQRTDSSTNKLGELLLDAHLIDREQFGKAMQRSLATGLPLGRILVLNGAISEHILTEALEIQVRIRDGMMERVEAVTALRAQIGDFDSEELQRQTMPFKAALTEAPRRKGVRLGELLVMAGLMAETDVMSALEIGLLQEQLIGQVFIAQGFVTEELLEVALALQQKVDQNILQPLEAGQALAKISATGITVDEAIDGFVAPKEQVYEPLTFDKMLVLARVISSEDIESALEQVLQSPQLLAQMLRMTNFIDEHTSSAVLQCYSMMSNNFLSQDDAIIALDYCLNKEVERKITFGEALSELGWSATQSLQIHAKNSVDITHIRLQAMLAPESHTQSEEAPASDESVTSAEGYAQAEADITESPLSEVPAEEIALEEDLQELQAAGDRTVEAEPAAFEEHVELNMVAEELPQPEAFNEVAAAEELTIEEVSVEVAPIEAASEPVSDLLVEEEFVHVVEEAIIADDANEVVQIADDPDEFVVRETDESSAEIAQRVAAASQPAEVIDEAIPTVDEEDNAFRQEFDLEASDIVKQTEIAAPAEPESEPIAAKTPSTTPSGLMGSLSSLLSSQNPAPETAPPAQKEGSGALGQMFSSKNASIDDDAGNDALRDLFAPDKDDAPAAAAVVAAGPSNGKSAEHEEALVAPSVGTSTENAEPSKGLGELMRSASTTTTGPHPIQGRATESGDAHVEPAAAGGGGNSSLSSMLTKASGAHSVANKFVGLGRVSGSAPAASSAPASAPAPAAPAPAPAAPAVAASTPVPSAATPAAPAAAPVLPAEPESVSEDLDVDGSADSSGNNGGSSASLPVAEPVTDFAQHEFKITDKGETIASADHVENQGSAQTAKSGSAFADLVAPSAPADESLAVKSPAAPAAQGSLLARVKAASAAAAVSDEGGAPVAAAAPVASPGPVSPPVVTAASAAAPATPTAPSPPPAPASSAAPAAASETPVVVAQKVEQPATPVPAAAAPVVPKPEPKVSESPAPAPPATSAPEAVASSPAAAAATPPAPAPAPAAVPAESAEAKPEVKEALGSALNRLAESYYQQGNYAEAQGLYEKILSVKQQQLGPKHPSLGADLTNLAGVLCVQGKFAQAEPFVRKVVQLVEAQDPPDVLKLASSINTLAGILFQQGKLAECEPLLGRALQLRREFLGEEHMEVADSLRDYAKLLKKLGRIEDAEKHYLQAKAIVAKRQQQSES